MEKKKLGIVCCLLVLLVATLFSCNTKKEQKEAETEDQKTILYIGDSIAEALLGPSPITERDSYSYYAIIGEMNDYRYINRAISGATSNGFKHAVLCDDEEFTNDSAALRRYWIEQADIIEISMLGNDLLGPDMAEWAINTAKLHTQGKNEVDPNYREELEESRENITIAFEEIRRLNPNAVIIWQTLYNPLTDSSVLLPNRRKTQFANEQKAGNISAEYTFRDAAGMLVEALNQLVYDLQAQYPANFCIADVYSAFNDFFDEDIEKGKQLIYPDCVHPSNYGHAVIAECVQKVLEEQGIAKEGALEQYKNLASERLDRLYQDTSVDCTAVKNKINVSTDMKGVRESYFGDTQGVKPICKNNANAYTDAVTFTEDKFFELESFLLDGEEIATLNLGEFFGDDLESVLELLPESIDLLDKMKSGFQFNADGTCQMRITPSETVMNLLALLMQWVPEIYDTDIIYYFENPIFDSADLNAYANGLFPGFDITELKESLSLLQTAGAVLEGIDTDGENFSALETSLKEDGTLPDDFILPTNISFTLNGYYTVETVEGQGKVIYMRYVRTEDDTIPMFCCKLSEEDEYGSQTVNFRVEFAHVNVMCRY